MVSSTMLKHTIAKIKDVNKLMIFLEANKDGDSKLRKLSSMLAYALLLYGYEGWLGVKISMCMKAIKMLLGVRQSTPNDTCLIEAGYPSLEAAIRQRQRKFISFDEEGA